MAIDPIYYLVNISPDTKYIALFVQLIFHANDCNCFIVSFRNAKVYIGQDYSYDLESVSVTTPHGIHDHTSLE